MFGYYSWILKKLPVPTQFAEAVLAVQIACCGSVVTLANGPVCRVHQSSTVQFVRFCWAACQVGNGPIEDLNLPAQVALHHVPELISRHSFLDTPNLGLVQAFAKRVFDRSVFEVPSWSCWTSTLTLLSPTNFTSTSNTSGSWFLAGLITNSI